MTIVVSETEILEADGLGGVIYSTEDMLHFIVDLNPEERRLFHGFKKEFGGTVQWRSANTDHEQTGAMGSRRQEPPLD
jgi:hypothetical protein